MRPWEKDYGGGGEPKEQKPWERDYSAGGQPQAPTQQPIEGTYEDHPFAEAPVTAKEERSPWDMFVGGFETLGTMLTGATGGALGTAGGTLLGIGEAIADGTYGTQEGVQTVADRASQGGDMLTYSPRTEAGRDYVETAGEFGEQFAGLEGLAGPLQGPLATARTFGPRGASYGMDVWLRLQLTLVTESRVVSR